jgi:hypothetical protein
MSGCIDVYGRLIWDGAIGKMFCTCATGQNPQTNKAIEIARRRMLKINLNLRMSTLYTISKPYGIISSHIE